MFVSRAPEMLKVWYGPAAGWHSTHDEQPLHIAIMVVIMLAAMALL
jgi:hypothetical protein